MFYYKILAQNNDNLVNDTTTFLTEITVNKLVQGLIIILSAYLLIKIGEKLNNWLSEEVAIRFRLVLRQSLPFFRAAILLIAAILLARIFLRLSTTNILALTGTISVALGFAFKDYVSSLIAGFFALFEVPYRVGDRVQIGEHYGEIISYGLRGIRLRTLADNIVTIPHNKIWTEAISNSNDGALEAQVVTDFYFAHDVDVKLVMKILYQAAYTSQYTQLKLPILVTMEETPWSTHFMIKSYPMDARYETIYRTDLLQRSKEALARAGIAYPAQFRSGGISQKINY